MKKKPESIEKLNSFGKEGLASTEINYFEMLFGIFKRQEFNEKEIDSIQDFFNSIRVFTFDQASAYKAAEIAGRLSNSGQIIEPQDVMIAGICIANNCSIATKDLKHFSRIKGLKVETY